MSESALTLPRMETTRDGRSVTVRYMDRDDREAFLAFTKTLPDHDLLFLRTDITDPDVVDGWLDNIDQERTVTIIAETEGRILGYASLHFSNAPWSQHVGELRVLLAEEARGQGLGRGLTETIFAQALDRGIEKMVAQMTIDQKGAIATFEERGFKPEALLRDHVKDRKGDKHDLLVFSHDVRSFQSQLNAYGVQAAGGD
jgi:L-amino acid N-acyltransferase YncA